MLGLRADWLRVFAVAAELDKEADVVFRSVPTRMGRHSSDLYSAAATLISGVPKNRILNFIELAVLGAERSTSESLLTDAPDRGVPASSTLSLVINRMATEESTSVFIQEI